MEVWGLARATFGKNLAPSVTTSSGDLAGGVQGIVICMTTKVIFQNMYEHIDAKFWCPMPLKGSYEPLGEAAWMCALIAGDVMWTLDNRWRQQAKGRYYKDFGGNDMAFAAWWEKYKTCLPQRILLLFVLGLLDFSTTPTSSRLP